MGFTVHLKDKDEPIRIEADRVVPNPEAMLFLKDGGGPAVAAIPHANVSHIVKE